LARRHPPRQDKDGNRAKCGFNVVSAKPTLGSDESNRLNDWIVGRQHLRKWLIPSGENHSGNRSLQYENRPTKQSSTLSLGLALREIKNEARYLISAEVPNTLLSRLRLKEQTKPALTSQVLPSFGDKSVYKPLTRQHPARHPRADKVLIVIATAGSSSGSRVAP